MFEINEGDSARDGGSVHVGRHVLSLLLTMNGARSRHGYIPQTQGRGIGDIRVDAPETFR